MLVLASCMPAAAHELTESLSLDGVLSAAVQCQELSQYPDGDDICKYAAPLQPALTYRATRHDRLFLKLGFAAGNGLNAALPFNVGSWGADLEDDVRNINGSGRDYLLEAWYQHVFVLGRRNELDFTLGIIDASNYLDQNAYANDEYLQFMNPAFSNAPNTFFPSYDLGIAAQWRIGQWIFSGVMMEVHQTTTPDKYTFYGVQAGYRLDTSLGTGNYRLSINGDRGFVDAAGSSKENHDFLLISADQQLGRKVGLFIRLGWRLDDALIDYRAIYSGGADFKGAAWGRGLDNIGIAVAYLEGGDQNIARTNIVEAYYRLVFNPHLAVTADIQYMRDQYISAPGVEGMIYSLRATVNY
jgi:porin